LIVETNTAMKCFSKCKDTSLYL